MIADKGNFVLHAIYKCVDELGFVEQGASIADDLLNVRFLLRSKLARVEFTLENNDTEEVKQVNLLSIVFVVNSGAKRLDQRTYD